MITSIKGAKDIFEFLEKQKVGSLSNTIFELEQIIRRHEELQNMTEEVIKVIIPSDLVDDIYNNSYYFT